MLTKKVPVYYLLILILVASLATFYSCYAYYSHQEKLITEAAQANNVQSCLLNVQRLNGYKFIQPLVSTKQGCESENLRPVRQEIAQTLDNYKASGTITTASVYLRVFGQGEWVCINEGESYRPGSLLKVPELITFLREEELHPGTLNKRLSYNAPFTTVKNPLFTSKSIEVGNSYTIKELLRYMIEYSDNNATMLLNNNMDSKLFKQTFSDFGLKEPDMKASDYPIAVKDYGIFFEALYNAGYLNIDNSEFAVELLSKCNFKDGFVAGLPEGGSIAHKFGEAGDDNLHELHECGLIYSGNKRYELVVMTKGKVLSKLPEVLKNISKIVYQRLNS
jgi:beta-lactamase class A